MIYFLFAAHSRATFKCANLFFCFHVVTEPSLIWYFNYITWYLCFFKMLPQLVDIPESALTLYFHSFVMLGNRAFYINPSTQELPMSPMDLVLILAQISTWLCFPAAFISKFCPKKLIVCQLKAGFFKGGLCCHSFPTLCRLTLCTPGAGVLASFCLQWEANAVKGLPNSFFKPAQVTLFTVTGISKWM